MSDDDYTLDAFNPGEARERLRNATGIILKLEKDYMEAVQEAADAESVYRHELAKAFAALREAGEPVEAARIKGHGETAKFKRDTLAAAGAVRVAADRLENARDTRRSLWRLVEWSAAREMRAAQIQGRVPENSPGGTWP